MTARDVLAEIEQRTESALRPGTSVYRALDKTVIDNRTLVAALRAVLDLHRPMTKSEADILDLDAGDCFDCWQETPCDTVRAITDALNGVAAAGSDR